MNEFHRICSSGIFLWVSSTLLLTLGYFPLLVTSQGSICLSSDNGVTDCSNKQLTYVPRDLPPTTKLLRLGRNRLARIEVEDFPIVMPELEELDLSENQIYHIDTTTFCQKMPNLKILRLSKNKLSALPDISHCHMLVELHCVNNQISTLSGAALSGLTRLEKVDLTKNNLTTVTAASLPTNTSIKQLLLSNNAITRMSSGAFDHLRTLEKLRLSRNKLTTIEEEVFSGMVNLQLLDLSRNRLTEIGHVYFTKLKRLKTVNLERNRLTNLLDGSFYDCESLESLNLQSNMLTSVKAGPFFGLRNVQTLNLAKNNISVIEDLTWTQAPAVSSLDLSQNNLRIIRAQQFMSAKNVRQLKLSHNKITQIDEGSFDDLTKLDDLDLVNNELSDSLQSPANTVFSSLGQLTSLRLNNNQLQSITSKLLRGLDSLETLELSNNPVTTVESYAFSTLPSLVNLKMNTDSLVCDCKISWLPPWLQQKEMSANVQGRCAHPSDLVGESIFEISLDRFVCPSGEMPVTPFITREMQATNALRGSNVTLTCIATASSQSPLVVEWRKDSQIIPVSSGLIHTEASTADDRVALHTTYLRLVNITEEAEGQYQCGFKNEFGQDYSSNVPLLVLVFPSFTNKPSNVTVKTGQSAKLLCEATGYPQPFLSWSKDGGKNFPAARDRRFQVNPDNLNEFIIKNVQWADRGVYYCNATNNAGSTISNATVNVLVPPMFTEDITCANTKAGTYLLKCKADGNPKTPIVWYKDGKVIQASEKYIFSVTFNNLFIIDAKPEDSGMYMCSAKNLLGQVTQQCEIAIKDSSAEEPTNHPEAVSKKTAVLDQNTITGLIVIAVVCCVVGTSLVWVVIIYQTRRRQGRNGSNDTEETTAPLNSDIKTNSTHKIGDSVSNSSSQTKTDSFFEYQGSRDSPSAFCKVRGKFPTMDSELAAAMEPLNPNQESIDSLATEAHPLQYSHHTVGAGGYARRVSPEYYNGERIHPFSTFQPSRQHKLQMGEEQRTKPSHSISAEFIPYIDKRAPPPDLAQVLHQLRAPTQPPQAVIYPVHSHRGPVATSLRHIPYEEPGYMNLPRSAVTPSGPKPGEDQQYSDYMNIEPKDIHIYQNTSILSIHTSGNGTSDTSPNNTDVGVTSTHENTRRTTQSSAPISTNQHISKLSLSNQNTSKAANRNILSPSSTNTASLSADSTNDSCRSCNSRNLNQSNNSASAKSEISGKGSSLNHSEPSELNRVASSNIDTGKDHRRSHDNNAPLSPGRRREGLADSSFVERKYGLVFPDGTGT